MLRRIRFALILTFLAASLPISPGSARSNPQFIFAIAAPQKYSPEMMRKRAEAESVVARNKEKLRQNADDLQAHKAIGDAYLFLDEYESAFNSYREMLRVMPNNAEAYHGMAKTYETVGQYKEALDFYKKAVHSDPKFGSAQADLGRMLVKTFQYNDAINPLKEGIRLKAPKELDHDDYYSLGEAYLRTEQYKEAVVAYRKALEFIPGHVWTNAGIAEAYSALKQYDQAISSAKLALKEAPYDARTNRILGDAYAGMAQYDKAIEYYKESIRVSAHRFQVETLLRLGITYNRLGRHDEALSVFEKGILYARTPRQFSVESEIDPAFLGNLFFATAEANLNLGRGEAAAAAAQTYIEMQTWSDPNAPYAALLRYFGNKKSGRDEEALKTIRDALTHVTVDSWPGSIMKYVTGDLKEKDLFNKADTNDKMTEARAYVGLSLELAGRVDVARPHFEWVVKNGNREFIEYTMAQSALRRISSEKN